MIQQVNIGDFYPETGQRVRDDGTIANPANSVDTQGNQGVVVNGEKIVGPTLIATIPYSSFTASTTLNYKIGTVLNRNAKARTITIINQTNQSFGASQCGIFPYDSTITNPTNIPSGTGSGNFGNNSMSPNAWATGTSENVSILASHVDSCFVAIPMGATAPTSGNVLVYVTELF